VAELPDDHHCPWREEAERLRDELDKVQGELAAVRGELAAARSELDAVRGQLAAVMSAMEALERRVLGPKSEKMPPPEKELRKQESAADAEARRLAALERRREHAALKEKLRAETVPHHLTDDQRQCPSCGGVADRPLGDGKQTYLYEYVPGYFVRQCHVQEKAACRCGQFIATADPPARPIEGGHYGAGLFAHVIVIKCADATPLHRLAKQYQRLGIPMSRSTLTDLFHAAAEKLAPLSQRLMKHVAQSEIVQADETSLVMQKPFRRGFVWTFLTDEIITYRFAPDRSGDTPLAVLGGTRGTLVVDAYTGYNRVTEVDGRSRSACLAHVRRRFFEALTSKPVEARRALDLILDVYRVEHEAKQRRIVRTPAHLELRRTRGREAMDAFLAWLEEHKDAFPPKSALGQAISYARNRGDTLTRFLDDVRIPLDNNASERALRIVALGRKNFLFVGNPDCGDNLAGLYSLIATCDLHDVDPLEYLRYVLLRVDTHPASRIDELLPHRWTPPGRVSFAAAA
jgi:transposase